MEFDLEKNIKRWLKDHSKTGFFEDGQLAEIEDHIRIKIEQYRKKGFSDQQAFKLASEKWGKVDMVAKDERKVNENSQFFYPGLKHLKFILRLFRRSPITTAINAGGLILGITGAMVILLFVLKEYSYDEIHSKKDRIYRVELNSKSAGGTTHFVTTGPPTGQALMEDYEEVENFVTIKRGDEQLIRYNDQAFYEDQLYYVTQSFFEIFDFKLKFGDRKTALSQPNSVVITDRIATKYFGDTDPLGKSLETSNGTLLITGVLLPMLNTHFEMDLLVSFSSYEYPAFGSPTRWSWITFYNYIILDENTDAKRFSENLSDVVKANFNEERASSIEFTLHSLKDIYLSPSDDTADEIGPTSNRFYSYVLTLVAILIVTVAGLNYINISTALASKRAKEIGIKKALGAGKRALRIQFLAESVLTSFVSSLISIGLGYLIIRQLNPLGLDTPDYISFLDILIISTLALGLIIGLAAGIYPAMLLSSFKVEKALSVAYAKSSLTGGKTYLRKILVGSQYMISVSLLMVTLIILKQVDFVTKKDLGFSKERMLVVPLNEPEQRSRYHTFETMLEQHPEILGVAAARLGLEGLHGSYQFVEPGVSTNEAPRMSIYPVNLDFIDLLSIQQVQGRKFRDVSRLDSLHKFIMNESAVSLMGWTNEEALGKRGMLTGQGGIHGEVVGVVRDFHFEPLQNKIEPLILWFRENASNYVYIKMIETNFEKQIRLIEETFDNVYPEYIFEYQFLESRINENYQAHQSFSKALSSFSVLAILISCFGLFGLTIFIVQQKIKEIGIRKVLGANVYEILLLLNQEFFLLICITSLLAVPIGYYGGALWLENFAYRTSYGIEIFLISFVIISIITLVTISYHTIKAALANPAQIIRYE